jgi:hypothetical protein
MASPEDTESARRGSDSADRPGDRPVAVSVGSGRLPVDDERSFIDLRLYRFCRNILLPTSAFLAAIMTMGSAMLFLKDGVGPRFFVPVLAMVGSWVGLFLVAVSRRVKEAYVALSIRDADRAMYRAKRNGRDRIEVA